MILLFFYIPICTSIFILFLCFSLSVFFSLFITLSGFLSVFCPFLPNFYHFTSSEHVVRPSLNYDCAVPYSCVRLHGVYKLLTHDSTLVSNQQVV